jgi:23S rRNA pseudouridine2605 synthase
VKQREAGPRKIGLARALSKLGYCSRSQAADLIRAGEVRLNGSVRRDPETPVHLENDRILVKDRLAEAQSKLYWVMNKPRGVVTTASDEKGRETVYHVLKKSAQRNVTEDSLAWIAPVGRLDKASEGLLLLTNDSGWGARIAAPETHLEKTYHVQIATLANDEFVKALIRGVETGAGKDRERLRARQARVLRTGEKNCWLEIVLDEGKNRQIRRMMAEFGVEVLRLVRVAIGPLQLGNLAKGACRVLTHEEKQSLDHSMRNRPLRAEKSAHD